jgi:hypothetical protein
VMTLTEGNDLELRTLRDRVKKPISHLKVSEIENGVKEVREVVPTEEDLGELPCSP